MKSRVRGFTLIELLVVMVIAVLLMVVAAPSFKSFIAGQRVKTATGDFVSAAVFARSEAIKRNAAVTITADGAHWTDGWTIAAGSTQLGKQPSYSGVTMTSAATQIGYQGNGRLMASTAPSVEIEGADGSRRCVSFDLSGMPRTKKEACS